MYNKLFKRQRVEMTSGKGAKRVDRKVKREELAESSSLIIKLDVVSSNDATT